MEGKIITITRKGQATLPAEFRRKHGLDRKAIIIDTDEGLVVKPLPDPEEEMGSLKNVFERSSSELLEEGREPDAEREKELEEMT
ncbi:hypothetical protein AKJ65_08240 [candidate division MSBL1 archaeon SCGC-AAA259E19]|uniref:SpoVT-AbrB domain-containing protein n=1 Tax=candidate division MSBL1 archaeon SCGC-AAA259E19 TaxID=1698264 RepID=A0A133UCN9_9EURY|nr:hypothetical protein AKJ65_08240 [candidate division MSBL1 archaeon SCGC-AAA259E19]